MLLSLHHSRTTSPSDAMHRTGRTRAFVVTEQGQPVGVVSLQDICQGNDDQSINQLSINPSIDQPYPALLFPHIIKPTLTTHLTLICLDMACRDIAELLAHEDRHKRMEMLRQIKENRAFHDALPWPTERTNTDHFILHYSDRLTNLIRSDETRSFHHNLLWCTA